MLGSNFKAAPKHTGCAKRQIGQSNHRDDTPLCTQPVPGQFYWSASSSQRCLGFNATSENPTKSSKTSDACNTHSCTLCLEPSKSTATFHSFLGTLRSFRASSQSRTSKKRQKIKATWATLQQTNDWIYRSMLIPALKVPGARQGSKMGMQTHESSSKEERSSRAHQFALQASLNSEQGRGSPSRLWRPCGSKHTRSLGPCFFQWAKKIYPSCQIPRGVTYPFETVLKERVIVLVLFVSAGKVNNLERKHFPFPTRNRDGRREERRLENQFFAYELEGSRGANSRLFA